MRRYRETGTAVRHKRSIGFQTSDYRFTKTVKVVFIDTFLQPSALRPVIEIKSNCPTEVLITL